MFKKLHIEKLEFKPDFAAAAMRWDAYWKGENKRPMIQIKVPKAGVVPPPAPPYLACLREDIGNVIDKHLENLGAYDYVGEAMPFYYHSFGADTFAAFLGADLKLSDKSIGTSWCVPFVDDWDNIEIKFQKDGYWWKKFSEQAKIIKEKCDGKILIAHACMSSNLDALAAIRGIDNLLFDLVDYPDKVHRALDQVCDVFDELAPELTKLLDYDKYGCINAEWFYTRGYNNRPQCDMSCMISPDMFKEFVVPALEREQAISDCFVYHLDGPDAIKHLNTLGEMDIIDHITWVPGSGNTHLDWSWLQDKIFAYGKGTARGASKEEIKKICRETGALNMCFVTSAETKTEAEDFIAEIEKIYG